MKNLFLSFIFLGVAVFALLFFTFQNLNQFVTTQVASIIGIDINQVLDWSSQRGLNKNLTIGNSGRDVRLLQYAMNKVSPNFGSKNITGSFDAKTAKAVSDFQKSNNLNVNGTLDSNTRTLLNDLYFKELCPDGRGNIFPDEMTIHLNKSKSLPEDYIPSDLIDISDSVKTFKIICLKQDVAPFLKKMFDDAEDEGINFAVTSGFRRPEVQSLLYKALLFLKGEKAKYRVAEPLHSEHQLGTTIDLTEKSINYLGADSKFDGTVGDLWLKQNAYKYGFVLSYPRDKMFITGYDYEPWHYRFLGLEITKEIFDRDISVEEYFGSSEN